jgi:hypothetical protein
MRDPKAYLFVGGPEDGIVRVLDKPARNYAVPVLDPIEVQWVADPAEMERILREPVYVRTEIYHHEAIHGQNETWYFYRHESITLDEAIGMILSHYVSEDGKGRMRYGSTKQIGGGDHVAKPQQALEVRGPLPVGR